MTDVLDVQVKIFSCMNDIVHSSVGIATGCGLDDRESSVRVPAGAGNFSLHHRVQIDSGAHPASYPKSTVNSFLGVETDGT
jgi:hypothetical protein